MIFSVSVGGINTLVVDLIGQSSRDVIGRLFRRQGVLLLAVKTVNSDWCVGVLLLK